MANCNLTAQHLRKLLDYDPISGQFTWKIKLNSRSVVGNVAGYNANQRCVIRIDKKGYSSHRLVWLHVTGFWPSHGIDHIDGNRLNNKLSNLREATQAENCQNLKKPVDNTSGFIGVTRHTTTGKWEAKITCSKKKYYLGIYKTPELAYIAYLDAKAKIHTFNPIVRPQ